MASKGVTPDNNASISASRILKAVVPIAVVLVAVAWAVQSYLPSAAQSQLESSDLHRLLGKSSVAAQRFDGWTDANDDLLADSPADDLCVTPDKLVFTYVGEEDGTVWQPFLNALSEATSIEAAYVAYQSVDDQIKAMADGELHLAAFNTGAVPNVVDTVGFIPVSTLGAADSFGYKMNLLVRADSGIQQVKDLKGKRITFVDPKSNSGFKAPFVFLMNEHNMLPERDYNYGFSLDHNESMKELLAGKSDAAPVASDLFNRQVASGDIDGSKLRVLYQSERFPPVALGYVYNLAPGLRKAAAKVMKEFDWAGTPLEQEFGTAERDRFVAVDYRDDWADIRQIDDALEKARNRN